MKKVRVATVEGYWSTNIGNALFQISAKEIFKRLDAEVVVVPDMPGYIQVSKGNPSNYFEFMDHIDVDYFCVHGPLLRKESEKIIVPILHRLVQRGVKLLGLGIGAMHYDDASLSLYKSLFKNIPFEFISTRDENTFEFLKSHQNIKELHNGIDLGFFISRFAPQPQLLGRKQLLCLNFDQIPEINIFESKSGVITIDEKKYTYTKSLSKEPRGFVKKVLPFIYPFFKTFQVNNLNGYDIIRLDHRFNPYSRKKIYSSFGGFAMDTPAGYLLAYANSKLTLSNRVHANVATLSYGNMSMYFSDSKRAALLNRVGLNDIYEKPMSIDQELIDTELTHLCSKLKEVLLSS